MWCMMQESDIDGSTDAYDDHEFNQMMLRDGCFILFFIECIWCQNNKLMLYNEYLGALGFANVARDMFLLENQIPFVVLKVLLKLKFPDDRGEDVLNGFFNYLNYGEVVIRDEKVLENKHPLHLLELYRSYFISLSASLGLISTRSSMWRILGKEIISDEDYNYSKRNRRFASARELKAKWIFLDVSWNEEIKFDVHGYYVLQFKQPIQAMSSIAPERNTYSMEMETTETEDVMVEIPENQQFDNNKISVIRDWDDCVKGMETTKDYKRQRHIQKVPPLLLEGGKRHRNREYYEPAVVSLGPYHHNRPRLAQAENYKLITLEEYRLSTEKPIAFLYNKVFEVVHDARKCYIDGSTYAYSDEQFCQMMLRDGCFILFFIECISSQNNKLMLYNEYLGALGFANVARDMFLLENQIPFVVLKVLLKLKFPDDKGEDVLNGFFNYLNYGEVVTRDEKVLKNKHPLHLLELYRSYFISLSASHALGSNRTSSMGRRRKEKDAVEDYNYIKRNRSFVSVTELKAKGIFLKCAHDESRNEGIKFYSRLCYGELVLVRRAVSSNTKAIYLNMIAYEMCPHNPNDFRISTYLRVMKSLIIQRDDVKELRNNGILIHSLGRDEDVVHMYDEIEAPAVNLYMFHQLRRGIEKHCNNKCKTWVAELITIYFSSPWKTVALLVAAAILVTSFLQTYFTIRPVPDETSEDIVKLLRQCIHLKRSPPRLA
ncbi:hypothetical protein L1987_77482 [Smallanthus sonchifolius]|uniref:Uncharacterized protein n=1 Tax=Smallanthus sonchifolius TaxID=185202 RepID=A0ACB8ZB44_9ASTR|nr:hypothetical protein L1987_77482 [Smallanthus sonchifolius]